jgi:hypothetical protein
MSDIYTERSDHYRVIAIKLRECAQLTKLRAVRQELIEIANRLDRKADCADVLSYHDFLC